LPPDTLGRLDAVGRTGSQGRQMKYCFIQEHAEDCRVTLMCVALGVSRSGYYAWRKRGPSARELANRQLLAAIRAVYTASRQVYGYRRVYKALVSAQVACSRNRVARLMRQAGLRAKRYRRYRITTQSRHRRPIAPNHLARRFAAKSPNQKWVSDITYVRTHQGWLYLAVVLDLFSRYVVGWAMEPYLNDRLTLKALQMAFSRRRPPAGLLHHSDLGSQYASRHYRALLLEHQALASMSRTGNVYDNKPMESFFATLKTELIHHRTYPNRHQAKADIFEYIEVFYNRQRLHSTLNYQSPAEYEFLSVAP
jgi:putative transposase